MANDAGIKADGVRTVILVKTTPLQTPIWALVLAMAIATVGRFLTLPHL